MISRDARTILVFALRYALPRHTYALQLVSDYIKLNINSFEDWEVSGMLRDIEDYYPSDAFGGMDQREADDFRSFLEQILKIREDSHADIHTVGQRRASVSSGVRRKKH